MNTRQNEDEYEETSGSIGMYEGIGRFDLASQGICRTPCDAPDAVHKFLTFTDEPGRPGRQVQAFRFPARFLPQGPC
jgi:hypothetical protein